MEFETMLQTLWRLRLLVALGALASAAVAIYVGYVVSLSPVSLTPRATDFGAAKATMYVDYPRSNLAGNARDAVPLNARAEIFARFIATEPIEAAVAERVGVGTRDISVEGPFPNLPGRAGSEPSAQQRANQILGEGSRFRVFVDTEAELPTITLFTQAPTGDDAIDLARAITEAVQDYSERLRNTDRRTQQDAFEDALEASEADGSNLSAAERRQRERAFFQGGAVVRSVGEPLGGDVSDETSKLVLILVFAGAFAGWCAFLLVASAAVRATRPRR